MVTAKSTQARGRGPIGRRVMPPWRLSVVRGLLRKWDCGLLRGRAGYGLVPGGVQMARPCERVFVMVKHSRYLIVAGGGGLRGGEILGAGEGGGSVEVERCSGTEIAQSGVTLVVPLTPLEVDTHFYCLSSNSLSSFLSLSTLIGLIYHLMFEL